MQDRLLFVISPPRAGSTLLQQMLGSHSQIYTHPEPHLITPLAYLGYHGTVDKAPFDHINGAEAIRAFVSELPRGEDDYLDALRAYTDTLYGRMLEPSGRRYFLDKTPAYATGAAVPDQAVPEGQVHRADAPPAVGDEQLRQQLLRGQLAGGAGLQPDPRALRAGDGQVHPRAQKCRFCRSATRRWSRAPRASWRASSQFLGLEHEPDAVNYKKNFKAKEGMGDPIGVKKHDRPSTESVEKWVPELLSDPGKLKLARDIVVAARRRRPRDVGLPARHAVCAARAAAAASPLPQAAAVQQVRVSAARDARAQEGHRPAAARSAGEEASSTTATCCCASNYQPSVRRSTAASSAPKRSCERTLGCAWQPHGSSGR